MTFNTSALIGAAAILVLASCVFADNAVLEERAAWSPPTTAEVRAHVLQFASEQGELGDEVQLQLEVLWSVDGPELSGGELLQNTAATLAALDPTAKEVVTFCRENRRRFVLPEFAVLQDEATPPLMRSNLRLLYGSWLAQQELYDEALVQLKDLQPQDVVDPATLLFYQSVAHYRLLEKEPALERIEVLLDQEETIPRRYSSVAKLMEADLAPLKEDSLDEIARLMDAIRLELDHARAGKRVRDRQDEVLAKLDKMIEELEKQRQQQQQSASSSPPSSPAQDSTPGGSPQGTGRVDPKKIGDTDGWGNLPPKEREEALQQISKEFPSHFREVIEEYFRKLARDEAE